MKNIAHSAEQPQNITAAPYQSALENRKGEELAFLANKVLIAMAR